MRRTRVTWVLMAKPTPSDTIKESLDVTLTGRAIAKTARTNVVERTVVRSDYRAVVGDYLFDSDLDADAVFQAARSELELTGLRGDVSIHNCDHDDQERSTEDGCEMVASASKGGD